MSGEQESSIKRCDESQGHVTRGIPAQKKPALSGRGKKKRIFLLVLLGFLLDITNLLRQLLQRVFVSAVLHLEVWELSVVGLTICSSAPHLVASCRLALLEMP